MNVDEARRSSLVLGRWSDVERMRAVSRSRPGDVLIHCELPWIARDGMHVTVPGRHVQKFIVALLARPGTFISRLELIDLLYGDREDGGPDGADQRLTKIKWESDVIAPALGIRIDGAYGHGFAATFVAHRVCEEVAA